MEEIPLNRTEPERAITLKSLFFGLLGVLVVSGLAGFHDTHIPGPPMISMHLATAAFFYIFMVGFVWNLAVSRIMPGLTLSTRELIVVFGMTLVACFPPTSGLCRYFQRQLMLPWYYLNAGGKTDWEKFGIMDYLPGKLFPTPVPVMKHGVLQLDDTVYRGYFTGLAKGMENIGLTNVPWGAWLQPLAYWAPLIVLMSVCVMAMSLLVHRQWSEHEQLSYPIAQVASAFIKREKGKGVPDLFKSHLFWWGFVPVFLLYALEYIHLWFPVYVPGMNDIFPSLKVAELPIHDKFPLLTKCPQWWGIVYRTTYFSVIGLAYFVSTEISLTVGLAQVLLAVFAGWYFVATGGPVLDTEFTDMSISRCGAYIGYAAILIFTGRSYYKAIFMKAFSFSRPTEDDKASVMAARLTILSFTAFVAVLVVMGLDWLVALCFSLLLMLLFLVVTRVVCETGVPYVQAGWFPGSILVPLFGAAAVGPGPLVFAAWLGTILVQDPRS